MMTLYLHRGPANGTRLQTTVAQPYVTVSAADESATYDRTDGFRGEDRVYVWRKP